ncbi:hypothetical protein ACFPYJ_18415 [Paenibacillus solisilvae]|uniref:Uncharacterized protein n=1 Tax=Paenibacillus solisilvae TaxID=2486751 RepID=A0ABW0W1V8_9BACL
MKNRKIIFVSPQNVETVEEDFSPAALRRRRARSVGPVYFRKHGRAVGEIQVGIR